MARNTNKAKDLTTYRINQLEELVEKLDGSIKKHEEKDEVVHDEMRGSIQDNREEIIKLVTKIGLISTVIGSLGTLMLQKIWK